MLCFSETGDFSPGELMKAARTELPAMLEKRGHQVLMLDEGATRLGGVSTRAEGETYARFLKEHQGEFDGVILSLPNFGDEEAAVTALKDAGVAILIQAYPDDLDKMAPATRRDAFCGKMSITDVFTQYKLPFTTLTPHTVHPASPAFEANIEYFDVVCRVTRGMRGLRVGQIGARVTPFKTVRYDEVALQQNGITVEMLDMAGVFERMDKLDPAAQAFTAKADQLRAFTAWDGVPPANFENIVRLAVVLDHLVAEYDLHTLAIRCWSEIQTRYGISACVLVGLFCEQLLPMACETDVTNAITMHALGLASGQATCILDWNNNYGDEADKCILFHCGNAPASLMTARGCISSHAILDDALGISYGCNQGRLKPFDFTYGSMLTAQGKLNFYLGQGKFTQDPIPADFFGVAGVAQIENLQDVLLTISRAGHRHHVSVTPGLHRDGMVEAFSKYLGYEVIGL